jgi:putative ABC transport system permease protein
MSIASDLRYGLRFLRATPSFTIPALLSLALGIALNTTMFSIVSATLLRPVVDADPDLVRVGRSFRGDGSFRSVSYDEFVYLRTYATSFADLAGSAMETVSVSVGDNSEIAAVELVAGNYFRMLNVPFLHGGTFAIPDNPRGGPSVAVVSERFWRRHLAADAAALGRTLLVNNVSLTVVGVVSQEFRGVAFPGVVIDVWLPIGLTHEVLHRNDQFPPSMGALARLKEGATMTAARAELDVLAVRMSDESPARDRDRGFVVGDSSGVHPRIARVLRVVFSLLMATVGIVLLIACANVAGGLLARAAARQRELGIRLALGATRRRVVGQLLVESLVLAVLGAAAGIALSVWPIQLLNAVASRFDGPAGVPMLLGLALDTRVLLFTAAVASLTAIVFGLVPALHATRGNLVDALRGTRTPSGGGGRLRAALLVTQIALSFVLLVSSGLLFRSLRNAAVPEPGVDAARVAIASFGNLRSFGYDAARVERFHRDWLAAVRTLPGVDHAALASFVGERGFRVPGRTGDANLTVRAGVVSDGYFATMGQAIIAGQDFSAAPSTVPVAIVNEALARRYFPNEIAVGRRIGLGEDLAEHEIIGVVQDVRGSSLGGDLEPLVYVPGVPSTLRVRTSGAASALLVTIRRVGLGIEQNLPPYMGRTGEQEIASSLAAQRVVQAVVTTAGVIALLLATGGLYGLLTYNLEMRLKEVGIRITLGATARTLFRLIVGDVAKLTVIGIVVGVALAIGVTRFAEAMLYGVSPTDVFTFASVTTLLLLVTLAAGWMTVQQGVRVDPVALLRE